MTAQISFFLQFLSLLALGFFLFIVFYKSTTKIKKTTHPLPPGPVCYPIVGCLLEMVKNKPPFRWMHNHMQNINTEIACFRLGSVHVITVTSPELTRQFFKEQDDIFATRPDSMSARLTSNGYQSAALSPNTGDQWKKMRRVIVSEVLTTGIYQWLQEKRREEADHLVRYVYNKCRSPTKNGIVDMREVTRLYCGNTMRKMVFGKRFFGAGMEDGGAGIEDREHMDAVFLVLQYVYGFAITDYLPFLERCDFDGHKKIMNKALASLRKYQDTEVDNRVELWKNGVKNTNEDILDVLISLKDSNNNPLLSSEEIKAQLVEIIVSIIDNPSNAVEWALSEMINEPHFLDLAYKELDEVVGKNRLVQESDLPQLKYIKACVKEAFRLHPLAPFNLPHVSTANSIVGGYFIPKGSHVLISRPGLGRNPTVWEDPLKFKPERHIVDGSSHVVLNDSELRMWVFGIGKRGCPAAKLGSTVVMILFARLIQGFSWKQPFNASAVDLVESYDTMLLAKPLIALATPRLEPQVYDQLF